MRHVLKSLPRIAVLSAVASLLIATAFGIHALLSTGYAGTVASSQRADSLHAADSSISIAAVGDIMMGTTYPVPQLPPDDGRGMLVPFHAVLRAADIAFGNLEGPLLDGGTTTKCAGDTANCYAFRVPTRYGAYLKDAGFDLLSIANNHALDFGEQGRERTVRVLDSLGIAWSGIPASSAIRVVRGRRVGFIAFSYDDDSNNLRDLDRAKVLVRALAAQCHIVLVSFHGGAEGAKHQHVPHGEERAFGENRGALRQFTHAMIDAGADLVLGHGPHVVRGLEMYKQRLIAYSLGNFATYAMFNLNGPNGLTCILEARLGGDGRFLDGRLVPAKQFKPGGPVPDPVAAIIPVVRKLTTEDFGEAGPIIRDDGRIDIRR
ncbi:MAG: CapA family protein [Ignavibacteria bacterium]|nr:CapA family protein [Ignavibacteria bacterium]